jgi:type IV secretion system protein VirB9
MRICAAALLALSAAPAWAQVSPAPGPDDPRLQTLVQPQGQRARLVIFPEASLTLIMSPGERVQRVRLSDSSAFHVAVTGDDDSLSITSLRPGAIATILVQTTGGERQFDLETGRGLAAAYVVRLVASTPPPPRIAAQNERPDLAAMPGHYSLKGDQALRPERLADDGLKTYILWGDGQPLPAVLGVGASGQEEVVPGYMRGDIFTIDRVYPELVFRMDKQKTVALRQSERTGG